MIRNKEYWVKEFVNSYSISDQDARSVYSIISVYLLNLRSSVSTDLVLRIIREGLIPMLSIKDQEQLRNLIPN